MRERKLSVTKILRSGQFEEFKESVLRVIKSCPSCPASVPRVKFVKYKPLKNNELTTNEHGKDNPLHGENNVPASI
jgi:hypothetical protein